MTLSRRRALQGLAAGAGTLWLPRAPVDAAAPRALRLTPRVATQPLVEGAAAPPPTEIWGYDGRAPGPEIRARQGDRLEVAVVNRLPSPTTVHWHGIRLPVEMDGVPHAPTPPILPGAGFTYAFDLLDAGTFWYHPHYDDSEQLGRGLAGALIVEETSPPAVDRDVVWVLGDWRLDRAARIDGDFDSLFDMSHAGRLGNTVTLNGRVPETHAVAANERLRLRLINAANARIFELEFTDHEPTVLALDGQPLARPTAPGRIVLAPGQRVDLLLDCPHAPGRRFDVIDHGGGPGPMRHGTAAAYRLVTLVYGAPVRPAPRREPVVLPANPLPRPDLARAVPCRIELGGGAMGRLTRGRLEGEELDMARLAKRGRVWALNGVVGSSHYHVDAPLLTLRVGETGRLTVANDTAWPHPVHLHGFPVLALDPGADDAAAGTWRDTVLLAPGELADLAFVAERPGAWMFHCHILEHQNGGMMGFVNATP
ncbi:MAG: multicopper oxidase family protein [Proteobacteria bacterium]|nr:multicopper oxidase family protein [Pseudomonadota bacterium]